MKTTETTDEKPVANPEYCCVPEQYAERMIFRSGVDRPDEDRERSVTIA